MYIPAPSVRSDLPPNILVTKVDVESPLWMAGVGNICEGTSSTWIQSKTIEVLPIIIAPPISGQGYWAGWPSAIEVEERFETLEKVSVAESRQGDLIAVKVSLHSTYY